MKRTHQPYYGRSHTKKIINPAQPRISIAERRARKARKQLVKLFPHLAPRLHKGVSPGSIYQHALSLSQQPPGRAVKNNYPFTNRH